MHAIARAGPKLASGQDGLRNMARHIDVWLLFSIGTGGFGTGGGTS